MRDWYLGLDDPLTLTLAADFRLCQPDYLNDHIWELEPGSGDPPALPSRTGVPPVFAARTVAVRPGSEVEGVRF